MPSLDEIMKMAQAAQEQLQSAQDNLEKVEVEGVAGGGLVKVRATAKGRILGLDIDDSLIDPKEKGMLEDLIAAAINDARGKADAAAGEQMKAMTAGMPLPPGFKLPF
ncbi:YbaB/EbfC family nucleoid-associated protein [Sphingomonas sp. LY29]|uniref:YbaB/EbfC family nucleoid-associated protein n=1 Tax=unclassified Sphingomonas TaxID=196159 RepID=UPI002ADEDC6B|nr:MULTISPECIES: YbaB/EbfC family nucleoid-associated protein [unclassified Sphingomonas]MEA1071167.1 YbaB/EbfC family nucleoid-associated protein [Sphingomonas sp. LY160]WRP26114.1 YbaB/EbfC family nucleoid-associated protein [Sphingomonas sp. LY29]